MRRLAVLLALAWSWVASADPSPRPVAIPDTPAGGFVTTWLDAYNSADVQQIERYRALYHRESPAQVWLDMHEMTGKLTPVRVEAAGPNEITVLLAEAKGDQFWQEQVSIDPANPMKVASAGLSPTDRPPGFEIPRLPRAELDRLTTQRLAQDTAADRFSGTMLVTRHGKVIYENALGLADRATRVPVTMETRFRLGSANKMFTAVSVLQLVDQGRIALDAPIGTYLKDYPNADFARNVTVRQLLSHTGGAGDIFTPEYEAKRLDVRTLADYVALYGQRAQDTSPDGRNEYSNYGFVLLGRIVEAVSGQDYYSYVRQHVFEPAGMKDTDSLPEETPVPQRAHGYTKGPDGKLVDNGDTLPWRGSAAGGGYSTAGDMARFGAALRSGKLLSQELLEQATTPQRPDGWYGYGFNVGGRGPTRNWGHGGGAPGMNASFRVYPELDAVVVALSNLDPMAAEAAADFYANRMALDE